MTLKSKTRVQDYGPPYLMFSNEDHCFLASEIISQFKEMGYPDDMKENMEAPITELSMVGRLHRHILHSMGINTADQFVRFIDKNFHY